ncbi:MAG: hypothetical protein ACK5KL_02620 [Dysgonomonas sp.]
MCTLQTVVDPDFLSQLKDVIVDANKTSWVYYVLTFIITILGTSLGVYLGFYSSKKQEKNRQKDYYRGRMKYFIKINETVQRIWKDQEIYFSCYLRDTIDNPYGQISCKQSPSIDSIKKLSDISTDDLYHSCLEFINGKINKIECFDDLFNNIVFVNRAVFDSVKITDEIHQRISSKAVDVQIKLTKLVSEAHNISLTALLKYDRVVQEACYDLYVRFNDLTQSDREPGYIITEMIHSIDNFIIFLWEYSNKAEYRELYDMALYFRKEHDNYINYITDQTNMIRRSVIDLNDSFNTINNISNVIKDSIKK